MPSQSYEAPTPLGTTEGVSTLPSRLPTQFLQHLIDRRRAAQILAKLDGRQIGQRAGRQHHRQGRYSADLDCW